MAVTLVTRESEIYGFTYLMMKPLRSFWSLKAEKIWSALAFGEALEA